MFQGFLLAGTGAVSELPGLVVVLDVVALILKELDDGVLGEIELSGQSVDGLLVGIQAHVADEALQDSQSLQRDPGPRAGLLRAVVGAL